MLKRLVRGLAIRHGMRANFMAKPFGGRSGSGMHLHTSLTDEAGRNLMADTGGDLAPLLLNAVAGLQRTLAQSMLLYAPNINSWRRFGRNSYAPTAATWGRNNRSVAIRVPAGTRPTATLNTARPVSMPTPISWRQACWPECTRASATSCNQRPKRRPMTPTAPMRCLRTGPLRLPARQAPRFSGKPWGEDGTCVPGAAAIGIRPLHGRGHGGRIRLFQQHDLTRKPRFPIANRCLRREIDLYR